MHCLVLLNSVLFKSCLFQMNQVNKLCFCCCYCSDWTSCESEDTLCPTWGRRQRWSHLNQRSTYLCQSLEHSYRAFLIDHTKIRWVNTHTGPLPKVMSRYCELKQKYNAFLSSQIMILWVKHRCRVFTKGCMKVPVCKIRNRCRAFTKGCIKIQWDKEQKCCIKIWWVKHGDSAFIKCCIKIQWVKTRYRAFTKGCIKIQWYIEQMQAFYQRLYQDTMG